MNTQGPLCCDFKTVTAEREAARLGVSPAGAPTEVSRETLRRGRVSPLPTTTPIFSGPRIWSFPTPQ